LAAVDIANRANNLESPLPLGRILANAVEKPLQVRRAYRIILKADVVQPFGGNIRRVGAKFGKFRFPPKTSPITVLDDRPQDQRQRPRESHGCAIWAKACFERVQLPESVGSGKVRCVGYGRKALALSVHPSGLGFIGRQIKLGRSPQRRQRQHCDGGDSCAPPQFLLRHGLAPWNWAVRNCPTGWIIAQVPIFTAH
jgi:hypothetical protein